MSYTFNKKISYKFKDVTGTAEINDTGWAIMDGDKQVGGIYYEAHEFSPGVKICFLVGVEILPELRGQGIGTAVVRQLLEESHCIFAGVQKGKVWEWWQHLGASQTTLVVEKENPQEAHTILFVLPRQGEDVQQWRLILKTALGAKDIDPANMPTFTG